MSNDFIESAVEQVEGNGAEINSFDSINSTWEEVITPGLITAPQLSSNILTGWVGDFVDALSESTQTPLGLSVMMALSVVATCVQKRFEVSPYQDDYKEPLSLWTLTAMPPASRKTAVVNALTAPLVEWESEENEKIKDDILEAETKRIVTLKAIEQLQTEAAKAKDSLGRMEFIHEINKLKSEMPDEILPPRLWTSDVTPERLQSLMSEHGERMGLISDEGGIFEIMAGLYSGGKANIDVFLQSHAGHGIRVDRGSRATFLDKPALSFGLAVQPEILSGFGNKGKSHFRGVGALARFMYCFPVSNIGDRDVGKRIPIPEDIKRRYRDGIFDLLRIQPVLDETGTEVPRVIHVNEEALDIWKQFSQYIESRQGERREFESIQDWTGKLPGAALRIAGLCNVAINIDQNTEINKAEMTRVLDFCESLIPHTQKAFNSMGADQTIADANIVLRWIKDKGELHFKRGDCQRDHHGRFLKVDRLLKALDVLIGWNVISEVSPAKTGTPGRPALVYHVNPAVLLGGKL